MIVCSVNRSFYLRLKCQDIMIIDSHGIDHADTKNGSESLAIAVTNSITAATT